MGKKITTKEIDKCIKENPYTTFDQCSICNGIEEGQVMANVDEDDLNSYDLICDECLAKTL